MKSKKTTYSLFAIVSLILLVSFVVAVDNFSVSTNSVTFNPTTNTQTLTVTNNDADETLNLLFPSTVTVDSVVFNIAGNSSISNGTSDTLTITPQSAIDFSEFRLGDVVSNTFTVSESGNPSNSQVVTVRIEDTEYCEHPNLRGNLDVTIDDINADGFADEDDEWYPLDKIEIDVDVDNNGPEDVDNIEVEWIILTDDGKKIVDGDLKDFDLNDGDDDTVTIEFTLDPDDVDDSTEDYVLYVRATGEDAEFDDDDTCDSDSQNIKIVIESDFVIVDEDSVQYPETVRPGQTFQVSGDLWNIGDDDQDDVSVRLSILNLEASEFFLVGDIDSFEKEEFIHGLMVPASAQPGNYNLRIEVYDEDDDIYENDNDDESRFSFPLVISGESDDSGGSDSGTGTSAIISARLESGGKAGEPLSVRVTVTNTGSETSTYTIGAAGYSNWADSVNLDRTALLLSEGESQDVLFEFQVKENVSGDQSFNVELLSGNRLVLRQPVAVTIEGVSRGGFLTGGVVGINSSNWYLWGIGLLNVILVIIIIIVAVRVANR